MKDATKTMQSYHHYPKSLPYILIVILMIHLKHTILSLTIIVVKRSKKRTKYTSANEKFMCLVSSAKDLVQSLALITNCFLASANYSRFILFLHSQELECTPVAKSFAVKMTGWLHRQPSS